MPEHSTAPPPPAATPAGAATHVTAASTPLIDIGINLAHESYEEDRDEVVQRARAAGVAQLIVTGSSLASTRKAISLAQQRPGQLFATAGVHPHHASQFTAEHGSELLQLARQPEVVAVGECGLDYFRNFSPPVAQQRAFHAQLELAAQVGKPVFLHQRDAHADFIAILREHAAQWRGVAHCFTGSGEELAAYLDLGLAIGITGWICDERRGAHLAALMPRIPAQRLLLETDGPYLLPRDLKPKPAARRNEPAYLPHIAAAVARARNESVTSLAQLSTAATRALFHLPAP
jgi:TatD DNase family protein